MSTFRYVEPTRFDEAIDLLGDDAFEAHLLAGGTALVPLLKLGYLQPSVVVGMRRLPGLRAIERRGDELIIGSLVTHTEIAESPVVRAGWPLLADACAAVGTVRIRNQATLGGNIVHADPNQDPPPALLVLEAVARIAGPAGERRVPLRDIFVDVLETSLERGEILLDVTIPAPPPGCRMAYRKFLPRSQDDYATVAIAALLRVDADDRIAEARIALAGAGPRPFRATEVELAMVGQRPTAEAIAAAATALDQVADPIDDVRGSANYKRAMARVWVERTVGALSGVAVA
ncbi:MAG: FAD binding domain-containing protein [Candidatus Limnocylindrales bacterium]